MALFNNETSEQWGKVYAINAFSIYFVTVAFLGLLAKGSAHYNSVVINITSISGITKLAQRHVSPWGLHLSENDDKGARSLRTIAAKRRRHI